MYTWNGSDQFNAQQNLFGADVASSKYGVRIIADIGGSPPQTQGPRSRWSFLKLASDTTKLCGIIFYDAGVVVLNLGTSTQASDIQWGSGLTASHASGSPEGFRYAHDTATASARTAGKGGDGGLGGDDTMRPVFEPFDRINGELSGMAPN